MPIYKGRKLREYIENQEIPDYQTNPAYELLQHLKEPGTGVYILSGLKGMGKSTAIQQAIKKIGAYEETIYGFGWFEDVKQVEVEIWEKLPVKYIFLEEITAAKNFTARLWALCALGHDRWDDQELTLSVTGQNINEYLLKHGGCKVVMTGDESLLLEWCINAELPADVHVIRFQQPDIWDIRLLSEKHKDLTLQDYICMRSSYGSGINSQLMAHTYVDEAVVANICKSFKQWRSERIRGALGVMEQAELAEFIKKCIDIICRRDLLHMLKGDCGWNVPILSIKDNEYVAQTEHDIRDYLLYETPLLPEERDAWEDMQGVFRLIDFTEADNDQAEHIIIKNSSVRFWLDIDVIEKMLKDEDWIAVKDEEKSCICAGFLRALSYYLEQEYVKKMEEK